MRQQDPIPAVLDRVPMVVASLVIGYFAVTSDPNWLLALIFVAVFLT